MNLTQITVATAGQNYQRPQASCGRCGDPEDSFRSDATPIVTGTVAQMLQANPGLTPGDVKQILTETAANGVVQPEVAIRSAVAPVIFDDSPTAVPNEPHIATVALKPSQVATPWALRQTGNLLIDQMERFPTYTAVVGVVEGGTEETRLVVASRPDAVSSGMMEGIYEINQRLGSSKLVKEQARAYPRKYERVQQVDEEGRVHTMRVPGPLDEAGLATALDQGRELNQYDMLRDLVQGLPQGKRVAILLGGGSAAGKSTLIKEIQKFAGDRKVVPVMGDMYFKDVDSEGFPLTTEGTPYWDHQDFMDIPRLKEDLATLIQTGEADLPVYNFKDQRPGGWRRPTPYTGFREEKPNHVKVGGDDILVLDSIHATNEVVVEHLEKLGLDYVAVFLDSPRAEDRLLRRLVRDFEERGGRTPDESFKIWDLTTWRGEKEFIKPTTLALDVARDVFLVTKFPKDLSLPREELEARADAMKHFGVQPSYEAFGTPPDQMGAFAKQEEARYQAVLADASASAEDREKAQKRLALLQEAPGYQAS
ncbi:MAG: S8 family serine peptidase [Candidatus Eremiobacterota bacterium]